MNKENKKGNVRMSDRNKCVEYDGHVISQCGSNHHIMVSKDGNMMFHTACDHDMTEEELVHFYNNGYRTIRNSIDKTFDTYFSSKFKDEDTEE